ncbi:MAG: hypothetical protein GY928_21265 [Colwellia sp.]|nr:hypothetical protein [Colwellia sp.]
MKRSDFVEWEKEEIEDDRIYIAKEDVMSFIDEVESDIGHCFDLLNDISSVDDLSQIVSCLDVLKDLKDKTY